MRKNTCAKCGAKELKRWPDDFPGSDKWPTTLISPTLALAGGPIGKILVCMGCGHNQDV